MINAYKLPSRWQSSHALLCFARYTIQKKNKGLLINWAIVSSYSQLSLSEFQKHDAPRSIASIVRAHFQFFSLSHQTKRQLRRVQSAKPHFQVRFAHHYTLSKEWPAPYLVTVWLTKRLTNWLIVKQSGCLRDTLTGWLVVNCSECLPCFFKRWIALSGG